MTERKGSPFALAAAGSTALFLFSLCFFLRFRDKAVLSFMAESNIVLYACALVVFAGSFFALTALLTRVRGPGEALDRLLHRPLSSRDSLLLGGGCVAVVSALLLHRRFFAEWNEFAVAFPAGSIHDLPRWAGGLFFIVVGAGALLLTFLKKDLPGWLVWPCCLLFAALCFAATLTVDLNAGNLHHGVAYVETIYNVYYGVPYTANTMGIYGHYGLFYAPLMRLFHLDIVGLNVVIALVAAAVSLCCSWLLHVGLKTNWMKILGTFACGFTVVTARTENYYQVQPHRVIFPLLLLVALVWQSRHGRWGWRCRLADYLLALLAILWNTESGLFCLIALTGALVVRDWMEFSWASRRMAGRYLVHLLLCLGAVLGAMGVVFLYNCLCGWPAFDGKLFFAPLLTPSYMNDVLRYDMRIQNSAWVYVLVLFCGTLLAALRHTSLFGPPRAGAADGRQPVLAALALLGLLNFSYYANRAAYYNLDIVLQLSILAVCMAAEANLERLRTLRQGGTVAAALRAALAACGVMVAAVLGLEAALFAPKLLWVKYQAGQWSTGNLQAVCEEIRQNVPEDTYAFGPALTTYYQMLGWDTHAHYTDFSDLTVFGEDTTRKIVEEAVENGAFLTTTLDKAPDVVEKILEKEPDFTLVWSSEEAGFPLQYWSLTKQS